jgi:hypothetical protein
MQAIPARGSKVDASDEVYACKSLLQIEMQVGPVHASFDCVLSHFKGQTIQSNGVGSHCSKKMSQTLNSRVSSFGLQNCGGQLKSRSTDNV